MGHLGHITEGEMLKFLSICAVLVALGVVSVVSIPMDMEAVTTIRPEATTEDTTGRLLSLPVPEKCANRPKHFEHGGHNYWFSGDEENFTDHKVDWLDGRNICREYSMDLVSLETPTEHELIEKFIKDNDLPYVWSSGRLCNFKGCDRETSSLQQLMDGSGLVQESKWHPPTPLPQVGAISHGHSQDTKPNLETTMCRSLTMLNLISMVV